MAKTSTISLQKKYPTRRSMRHQRVAPRVVIKANVQYGIEKIPAGIEIR
jgi:hypothetical protein